MNTGEVVRKSMTILLPTYERLQYYGQTSESFSDVIDNIIDYAELSGMTREKLIRMKQERGMQSYPRQ